MGCTHMCDEQERAIQAYDDANCPLCLRAQLASMTKRAEDERECNLANCRELLVADQKICAALHAQLTAEAKLATAQKNYFDLCDAVCRESTSVDDACRQARETRAKLSEMTKRAETAERDMACRNELTARLAAAEAKLATAERVVERARLLYWTPSDKEGTRYGLRPSDEKNLAVWNAITDHDAATGRLRPRALGIDPSKEHGK